MFSYCYKLFTSLQSSSLFFICRHKNAWLRCLWVGQRVVQENAVIFNEAILGLLVSKFSANAFKIFK